MLASAPNWFALLDGQGIERPAAEIPVSRSLHAVLTFIDIAVEELKPEYMRGYGEVPAAAAVELSGIAGELRGLVSQLDRYVVHGSQENLQRRLEQLEQAGDEVALLKKLETAITDHGLVEFRSTLSMILERLEDNGFEIAIFGRVSSGQVVAAERDFGDRHIAGGGYAHHRRAHSHHFRQEPGH